MTSTIFALRSRSSFLLIASTPRYAKRERQTRLLSFCLSVVLRAKKERAHTPQRDGKERRKFLSVFLGTNELFELVFFFSKFSIYRTNRTKTRGKERKAEHSLKKKKRQKRKKRVVVGRFFPPRTTHQSVTNVMIPPIISQNTLFLLRLKLSTQTLSSTIC